MHLLVLLLAVLVIVLLRWLVAHGFSAVLYALSHSAGSKMILRQDLIHFSAVYIIYAGGMNLFFHGRKEAEPENDGIKNR